MNRELELLGRNIRYKKEYVGNDIYRLYIKKNEIELLENYLTELEQIKNAKPSKALECLEEIKGYRTGGINSVEIYLQETKEYKTIKQALLKAEKQEKAWKIIKEKNVDMFELKCCSSAKSYNECISFKIGFVKNYELTQEEFELLKEMLE